jgi:hypothetical protein
MVWDRVTLCRATHIIYPFILKKSFHFLLNENRRCPKSQSADLVMFDRRGRTPTGHLVTAMTFFEEAALLHHYDLIC